MPALVISVTYYDGWFGSGMGSRFQTELLADVVYNMQFTKTKILLKNHL